MTASADVPKLADMDLLSLTICFSSMYVVVGLMLYSAKAGWKPVRRPGQLTDILLWRDSLWEEMAAGQTDAGPANLRGEAKNPDTGTRLMSGRVPALYREAAAASVGAASPLSNSASRS